MNPTHVLGSDLMALDNARLNAKVGALELELAKLRLFVRYGLSDADSFDTTTGAITRAPEQGHG